MLSYSYISRDDAKSALMFCVLRFVVLVAAVEIRIGRLY